MADKKISELPLIQTISGSTVVVPMVHDGTTIQIPIERLSLFTSQFSATTASNTFIGNQTVNGNVVITGKLTAQELFTEITSASIIFESGSTIFGNTADDTHIFTGTININGNVVGNAPLDFTSQSLNIATGSYNRLYNVTSSVHFTTASLNTQTGSQDLVNLRISSTTGSINTTTSSFNSVFLGISSVTGAINTTTSSFDSVFLGISSFTGSLNSLTGSYATTGSNTFRANQAITGSLSISAGEFNVTTGSGNMTSSLIFDHTQNDGVTLGLRHNDRLSVADHTFNVNVWAAGVYTTFVRNGTPYSILNVEAFDDNKIYLYRDTRLYNKSLVIDNNLTVQRGILIGSGSLNINNGELSITTGSGALTSSLNLTHTTVDPITGDATLALRYRNNQVGSENNAWKFVATDNGVQVRYDQYTTSNKMLFSLSSFGSNFDKLLIWRDARLFGTGLTVDDSLLVKGVITGSLLATNGVVSSSNQLFELNAFTGSVIGQTNTISTFTASINFTTQSLNTQTGSQDLVNRGISSVTGSINTTTSSFNSVFSQIGSTTSSLIGITNGLMAFTAALDSTYATDAQLYQLYQATASIHSTTASLNTQTGSQDLVNRGISSVTGSINTTTSSFNSVFLGISSVTGAMNTQSSSQNSVNLGISSVTGSLIGITNGLMAFTAALDSTYATDAQLYQLYQSTASIQFATASLNTQTGSQDLVNYNISVVTSSIDSHILKQATQTGSQDLVNLGISTFTGSLRSEVNLIEAYTASLKGAAIVSSSQQITNYYKFAETASANTFYGNQTFASSGGSGLRVYGGAGTHQWDMYLNGQNIRLSDNTAGDGALIVDTRAYFGGHVTASSNLTANKVVIGSTVTPTIPLEVYGQHKWYTTTGDGSELRGFFNPGGAADDPYLSLYQSDGTTEGIKITPDGIDFSANSNAAGMTSELLNDYEEGTWTPIDSSGASLTFTVLDARYTKIGRQVQCFAQITYPTTANGSNATIGGLPFTQANTSGGSYGAFVCYTTYNSPITWLNSSGGTISTAYSTAGVNLTNTDLSAKQFRLVWIYEA